MDYQWFPGHMTKAMRQMKEDIKLIDLIIELLDARIPLSSRNPEIDNLGQNKARLVLLNKADLADEKQNNKWIEYFKNHCIVYHRTVLERVLPGNGTEYKTVQLSAANVYSAAGC